MNILPAKPLEDGIQMDIHPVLGQRLLPELLRYG